MFLNIKIWQTCKVPCKVLKATPVIARDIEQLLEIHNPKVGSSSLPRAIAYCLASAGLFAVWALVLKDSTTETNLSHLARF